MGAKQPDGRKWPNAEWPLSQRESWKAAIGSGWMLPSGTAPPLSIRPGQSMPGPHRTLTLELPLAQTLLLT
jgi:hypothetical protein